MNRKFFFELCFKLFTVIGLAVLIALHFKSKESVVFVDSIKLVNGYHGMKKARKEYEAKTEVWKNNLDSLKVELEALIKDYEMKQAKLSAKEKQLTEELLQTKQAHFMNYRQI